MDIILVEWADTRFIDPIWFSLDDADFSTPLIKTVGFLAFEDKEKLVLVSSNDPYMGKVSGGMIIPKSIIKSRKVLK